MCPPERFIAEYLTFLQTTIALCLFLSYDVKEKVLLCLGFPDGSAVKNLPAMQGTGVQSLSQKDPLEKAPREYIDELKIRSFLPSVFLHVSS